MKKLFLMLILLTSSVFALNLGDFYKIYPIDADTLFMRSIFALNSDSKFDIFEIQTKNGYILFSYASKYYLLTVTKRYQNQSEIKILPQNSDFSQTEIVPKTVFSLIDAQNQIEQVK